MSLHPIESAVLNGGAFGYDTYEVYAANNEAEAREFLYGIAVQEQQHYVVVEVPGAVVARDRNGIYTPSSGWRGEGWTSVKWDDADADFRKHSWRHWGGSMANIRFHCLHCSQTLEALPDMAGDALACPRCGKQIAVPQPERRSGLKLKPPNQRTGWLSTMQPSNTDVSAVTSKNGIGINKVSGSPILDIVPDSEPQRMACDICSGLAKGGQRFSACRMRTVVAAGYSPFTSGHPGNLGMFAVAMGMSQEQASADWCARVMSDSSDWLVCPLCLERIRPYLTEKAHLATGAAREAPSRGLQVFLVVLMVAGMLGAWWLSHVFS